MKAVEYFEKYSDAIYKEIMEKHDTTQVQAMIHEMLLEAKEILKERHAMTDRAAVAVLKQQNQKWNAMIPKFQQAYDTPVLLRNGFYDIVNKTMYQGQLPSL